MTKTRRILFLDIDGVLNHSSTERESCPGMYGQEFSNLPRISEECVEAFNKVSAGLPDLEVVLSTSWKVNANIPAYLRARGVKGNIVGVTPEGPGLGYFRGMEVQEWLETNTTPEEDVRAVVVDDNPENPYCEPGMGYDSYYDFKPVEDLLVITDYDNGGLTNNTVNEIFRRLA